MKRLILGISVLLITACQTGPTLNQKAQSWVGQHIDNAISRFGKPTAVTKLSTGEVYEWTKTGGTQGTGQTNYGITSVQVSTQKCDIKMTVDVNKMIKYVRLDGNAC